jgi:hypothetical protein
MDVGSLEEKDFLGQLPKRRQQKSAFTSEEDVRLTELVTMMGVGAWSEIVKMMSGRTSRQCRERWNLYLSPRVCNEPWSPEEDAELIRLFQSVGPKWTSIAANFPKQTANNIKNRQKQLQRRAERVAALATVPPFAGLSRLHPQLNQHQPGNLE